MGAVEFLWVAGLWMATSSAFAAADLRVTRPAGGEAVVVSPGSEVDLTLRFTNAGDAPSAADFPYNVFVDRLDVDPEYAFAMDVGAACSPLVPIAGTLDSSRFTIPPLAPQASVECTIRIMRAAGSRSDVMVGVGVHAPDPSTGNSLKFLVGQPMASTLTIEKQSSFVSGGRIQQYVRVSFHNTGDVALEEMGFGRCTDGATATVELDFPGACATPGPSNTGYLCFMGSENFALPGPIAPGAQSSCLVRMTQPVPYTQGFGGRFEAANLVRNSLGGYTALLPSPGIDLTIDSARGRQTQRIPALGLASLAALLAFTLWGVRRALQ